MRPAARLELAACVEPAATVPSLRESTKPLWTPDAANDKESSLASNGSTRNRVALSFRREASCKFQEGSAASTIQPEPDATGNSRRLCRMCL
jgi:hypothetical protein